MIWLIELSVKATAILMLAVALSILLRRAASYVRYWLWSTALMGVLVLPALSTAMPSFRLPVLPSPSMAQPGSLTLTPTSVQRNLRPVSEPGTVPVDENASVEFLISSSSEADSSSMVSTPLTLEKKQWRTWLVCVWIIGAVLVLSRLLLGLFRAARLAHRATPIGSEHWKPLLEKLREQLDFSRRVRLLQSHETATPMTMGLLRPMVLLPAEAESWSYRRRWVVLLHELIHVKRSDWLMQIVAQVVCAIYWYNPLVWIAARRLSVERERSCDDGVITLGTRPTEYATHLLGVARSMATREIVSTAVLTMASRSELESRLKSILGGTRRRHRGMILGPLLLAWIIVVVGLSAVHPWGDPPLSEAVGHESAVASTFSRISTVLNSRSAPNPLMTKARTLFQEEQWLAAASAFEQCTKVDPDNGDAWFHLGYTLHAGGDLDRALVAHQKAAAFPRFRSMALYNVACAYALKGNKERAFSFLEQARRSGFYQDREWTLKDPDLESLHGDNRFHAFLDAVLSPSKQFEALYQGGDRAGLVALWQARPYLPVRLIISNLENSLQLLVSDGPEAQEQCEALRQRAILAATTADEAFGNNRFSRYVAAFTHWDDEQVERYRQRQLLQNEMNRNLRDRDYQQAISVGRRAEAMARELGDTVGLSLALYGVGNAHYAAVYYGYRDEGFDKQEALKAALACYAEALSITQDIGLENSEGLVLVGTAQVLLQLDHLPRARMIIADAIEHYGGRLPNNHSNRKKLARLIKLRRMAKDT